MLALAAFHAMHTTQMCAFWLLAAEALFVIPRISCMRGRVGLSCAVRTDHAENVWLQNGYKNFKDAIKSLEYVEFVDEIRIFDAVFHEKSRSSSRVGMIVQSPQPVAAQRVAGLFFCPWVGGEWF